MIRANDMLKLIREHNDSIVNQISKHFDLFFDNIVKKMLIDQNGYAAIDVANFLQYMRGKVPFDSLYDDEIVDRFVADLQEAGYAAESVCPPMNPDYISIQVLK